MSKPTTTSSASPFIGSAANGFRVSSLDPLTDSAWEEFVALHPESTAFHATSWAKVLHDTYGFKPRYLVLRDEDDRILAGVPLTEVGGGRMVGLPFSDLCPPIFTDNEMLDGLLMAVRELADAGVKNVELRGDDNSNAERLGFSKGSPLYHHVIDLEGGLEEIYKRVHLSARRAVTKAAKEGVQVRQAVTLEDMRRFYHLNVKTRKKLGLIPQPRRFFEHIHEHMMKAGQAYLLMADYKGKPIAGELVLGFNGRLIEKTSASNPRYLSLRPNHLLKWAAVELGVSNGYRSFDLGRCEPEHEGLRRFKQLWGGEELALNYYYYPSVQSGVPLAGEAKMRRRLMALAVRFAPLWALQTAGGLLYKRLA